MQDLIKNPIGTWFTSAQNWLVNTTHQAFGQSQVMNAREVKPALSVKQVEEFAAVVVLADRETRANLIPKVPILVADSVFAIGSTHEVCQDYATHWQTETKAFAIVCDGCSSSPKTDVGARLLAETFSSCLKSSVPTNEKFFADALTIFGASLRSIQQSLNANPAWFDATLVACLVDTSTKLATFFVWGDGHIRIEHENGSITTLDVDFDKNQNAPYYPSYEIFRQNGLKDYEDTYGELTPNRKWQSAMLEEPNDLHEDFLGFQISTEAIKSINLYSDGIGTLLQGDNTSVDIEQAASQLQDYRVIGQGALGRRFKKAQKLWRKEGIQHTDDLGVATIILSKDPEPEK